MMKWYNVGGKILPMKTYKNGGKVLHLQQGGAAVSPTVTTGVPQGGYAAPAINTYLAGNQSPQYGIGPIGAGVVGQPVNTNYVPPASTYVPPASTYVPPATTTTNTGGGQGSGPAATQQFVPAAITNTTPAATYAGETYDTTQDDGVLDVGAFDENTKIGNVTYSPEQIAEITADLSQSSEIPAEQRIADNTQYVDDILSDGVTYTREDGDFTVDPALLSAGPNILDASQVGADVDGDGTDDYLQNFQGNYNAQYDHAQANPTGMSTGVPLYNQGFDFSDAGIDALLPPTGEAAPNAGSTAWGPLAGIENFFAGIGGKNVQDTRFGVTGNRTAQQQANLEASQANPTAAGAATAARGQVEGKQTAATKQANAYVNEQAKFNATATPEEQAANQQDQLLGDFLWKYEGADNSQMKANYAAQAKAKGLDFGGQSPGDFISSDAVSGKNKDKLKADARAALTAKQQGIKAVDGGFNTAKTTAETTAGTDVLWNGQTRAATNAQHQAQAAATGAHADQSAGAQQAYQSNVQSGDQIKYDASVAKFGVDEANRLADQSASSAVQQHNMGGPIGLNQGGQPMTEEERMRQASAAKIARSQAQATPIRPQAPLQPQQVGKQGGGFGQMIGKKLLGAALGSIAGPLGPLLGGLFNEGGNVGGGKTISPTTRQLFDAKGNNIGQVPGDVIPGYNRESSGVGNQVDPFEGVAAKISADKAEGKPVDYAALAAIQHIRSIQNQAEKDKAMRAFMQKYPEFAVPGGSQGVVLRNQGGPISGNPQGYNEGGQTMATPIKKVMDMEKLESQKKMDEQKMEQAERAFQEGESRKDEAHQMAMQQKQEAHQQAMKLKKESATMKAPLSK